MKRSKSSDAHFSNSITIELPDTKFEIMHKTVSQRDAELPPLRESLPLQEIQNLQPRDAFFKIQVEEEKAEDEGSQQSHSESLQPRRSNPALQGNIQSKKISKTAEVYIEALLTKLEKAPA